MVQPCGFRLCVELWEARSTDQMLPPENTPPNLRVDLFSFSFIFFFNSFSAARRLTLNSGLYTASGSVCGLQTLVTKKGKKKSHIIFPLCLSGGRLQWEVTRARSHFSVWGENRWRPLAAIQGCKAASFASWLSSWNQGLWWSQRDITG